MYEDFKRGKIGEQSDRGVRNGLVILPVSSQIIEVKECT